MSLATLAIMLGLTAGASSTSVSNTCNAAGKDCPHNLNEADAADASALLQGRAQVNLKQTTATLDGDGDDDGSDWEDDWESDSGDSDGGGEYTCAELRQFYGENYNEGPCAPKRDDSWADNVPAGKKPIPKDMLGQECQASPGKMRCGADLGFCDLCGAGNACCKYNDPLISETNHPECCLATPDAFKDNTGKVQQMATRCVFPTSIGADKKCNYQKEKDKIWEGMADAFSNGGGSAGKTPKKKSPHPAPKVDLDGYKKKPGKADATKFPAKADHYLLIGMDESKWKQKCPAYKNDKYTLKADESKGGLYDMTYYKYPIMTSTNPVATFCGARYTNEVYQEKVDAAAKMAKKACDDMGDLCGGFTVGTDPECCGPKPPEGKPKVGCTEVAFLTSKDKLSDLKLSTNPCSLKTCEYGCNYATYIKE